MEQALNDLAEGKSRLLTAAILRHRIILSHEAEAEGKTPEEMIDWILDSVKVP